MVELYIYENADGKIDVEIEPNKNKKPIFILIPVRLQDKNNRERLRIDLMEADGNKRGEIFCDVLAIEKELYKLCEFGTGFLRPDIIKIRTAIDKNYRKLKTDKDELIVIHDIDDDIEKIVEMFIAYINEHEEIKNTQSSCYNIPVVEFKPYLEDSDYKYKYQDVKEKLKKLEFTKCAVGRSDRLVNDRGNNEPYRAISFYKNIDDRLKNLKTPKHSNQT